MDRPLIECVPNFSEGIDSNVINQISDSIKSVDGVKLLDVDPGKSTNRTVITFVGSPEDIVEAAFRGFKTATSLIDMSKHKGEHPRIGAVDVCPFVPLANITMEETVEWAKKLAERVGKELEFPVYLYEFAASSPDRTNLAVIRAGEYEGLQKKLEDPNWKPDFGPSTFNDHIKQTGASVIGARNFLVAYNVNLNTTSTRRANAVAFDIREQGRVIKDAKGNDVRKPGTLKKVKAIGWYIEEYGIAQVSINLTDLNVTPLHIAFDEACKSAHGRGLRVTGSELVGLIPKQCLIDAGKFYLTQQKRSLGIDEDEIIKIAIKSLGLSDVSVFDPKKKIIENILVEGKNLNPLMNLTVKGFVNSLAAESVTPGGGSAAALLGSLSAGLGTMVANLSSHKRGWDKRWEEFSNFAVKGQKLKAQLMELVDEDTKAFNSILEANRMPRGNDEEKKKRDEAVEKAVKFATEVPLQVMRLSFEAMGVAGEMAKIGLDSSASDAGVGALCARGAVMGAYLNVKTNVSGIKDKEYVEKVLKEAAEIADQTEKKEKEILADVEKKF